MMAPALTEPALAATWSFGKSFRSRALSLWVRRARCVGSVCSRKVRYFRNHVRSVDGKDRNRILRSLCPYLFHVLQGFNFGSSGCTWRGILSPILFSFINALDVAKRVLLTALAATSTSNAIPRRPPHSKNAGCSRLPTPTCAKCANSPTVIRRWSQSPRTRKRSVQWIILKTRGHLPRRLRAQDSTPNPRIVCSPRNYRTRELCERSPASGTGPRLFPKRSFRLRKTLRLRRAKVASQRRRRRKLNWRSEAYLGNRAFR